MPRKKSESSRTYTDLTTLGSGGMAKVYKANQESLGRVVAIKELKADLARDPSIVARFEREARYAAALRHESIVHIYDYFKEGGSYYIVMEYVEGTDLSHVLKQSGPMPPHIAALFALRIVRALEHAHERGDERGPILHRDIKPANILVSRLGEVKLSDFGIAKDTTNPNDNMTRTGQAVGTPSYMSPEQILGDAVDFRSDLFSLGIVLYEMITGQKPFVADTAGALLDKIRTQGYPDPRKLQRGTPRALLKIIRRCLRKETKKRWTSTTELRQALEAYALRPLRISPDETIKNWLYEAGVYASPTKVVNLSGTTGVPASPLPARIRAYAPRVAFAGLAIAAAASGFWLIPGLSFLDARPKPAPTVIATPVFSPPIPLATPAAAATPMHEEPPLISE